MPFPRVRVMLASLFSVSWYWRGMLLGSYNLSGLGYPVLLPWIAGTEMGSRASRKMGMLFIEDGNLG